METKSKVKHTAGEWKIDNESPRPGSIYVVVKDGFICSLPSNNASIHPECREEAQANAKLIAAAPELLKVLESIANDLDNLRYSLSDPQAQEVADMSTECKAAIAKATE